MYKNRLPEMIARFDNDQCPKLARLCHEYENLDRQFFGDEDICRLFDQYVVIDDRLAQEELDNYGTSPEARAYRKEWRKLTREMTKIMRRYIKGTKRYIKEWSKSRTEYIFTETGELHNGLWYTIMAIKDHVICTKFKGPWPKVIKLSTYNRRYH